MCIRRELGAVKSKYTLPKASLARAAQVHDAAQRQWRSCAKVENTLGNEGFCYVDGFEPRSAARVQ